ncbi:MAG TPA: DUF2334 domain-containing protein [Longimicrobium sp.]
MSVAEVPGWLPAGKRAAVVFHIDDIHPGRSTDAYEAGGDLARGALGHLVRLLDAHPQLRVTLFTTPDWREISPAPTRRLLARIPGVRDQVYLAPIHPRGTMRLDRHPELVEFLRGLPRTEIALHGLYHVHRGPRLPMEFQGQGVDECRSMLREAMSIFRAAGLPFSPGMTPPAFNAPPALLRAMAEEGLAWVASSRDVRTAPAPGARTAMSGLAGVPLAAPALLEGGRLVHFPTNFQATSPPERAWRIVEGGGLLSIKAHIVKDALGHVALDGLDALYANYLDLLFAELDRRYGDSLWWTTMGEVADTITRTNV